MPEAHKQAEGRELGFDLARSFAIVFMVLINFQLMLAAPPSPDDAVWSRALRWLTHVPSGRSSSLFVTLAGVGITLMARQARLSPGAWWARAAVVRTLLLRSLFLLGLGLLLWHVWWIDILHFYACYLAIAAISLVWLPDRVLAVVYASLLVAGGSLEVAAPEYLERPFLSPLGFLIDTLFDGVHPVVPWLAFVTYGIWFGRRDLSDVGTRMRFALAAGATVVAVELGSLVASAAVIATPSLRGFWPHVGVLATSWTPAPLYVVSACASATLMIVLAHEILARPGLRDRWVVRAMIATGQLALTLYLTHAIVGVVIPRLLFGWRDNLRVELVTAYWAGFVLSAIVGAAIWRRFLPRGPLEAVMRALTSWRLEREKLASSPSPEHPPTPVPSHARAFAAVIVTAAAILVLLRVVGVPGLSLAVGDDDRVGELSLFAQRQSHELILARPRLVVLETHSGLDLYLELDRIDEDGHGVRVAEDDDGGEHTEARIARVLEPGFYRVTVRPYAATTGPYRLSVAMSEPLE